MGRARQFAQSSFWLMISACSILLVGAIYRPLLGRILGPADLGRYTFIQTFVNYFLVIAFFGIRQVIVREIGKNHQVARSYLVTALKLRIITTLVAIAACYLTGIVLHREPLVTIGIYILCISIAAVAASDLFESVLVAYHRSIYIAIANVIGNTLKLGVGIWVLHAGYGLLGVIWVFVGTSFLTAVLGSFFTYRVINNEKQCDAGPGRLKYVSKEAAPFFVLDISTRLYGKNDILFLNLIRGNVVTGLYSAAYVFIDLLVNVNNNCAVAAYPMISKIHGEEEKQDGIGLAHAYERLHKHMLMISLTASVFLTTIGGDILQFVFGHKYQGAVPSLRVLAWTPPADISIVVSGIFLCAMYRQRLVAAIEVVMMTLNIAWTVCFIFMYGALGAAMATVGAAVVNAVVRYIYLRKYISSVSIINAWCKPLVCSAIMLTTVSLAAQLPWIWRLILLVLSCIVAIAVVRPYDSEDRHLVLSIFKRH